MLQVDLAKRLPQKEEMHITIDDLLASAGAPPVISFLSWEMSVNTISAVLETNHMLLLLVQHVF